MKIIAIVVAAYLFGVFMGYGSSHQHDHEKPGTSPADVFHDGGEWYSQDGCWHLQDGYWRPLRRCNIVRVPAP